MMKAPIQRTHQEPGFPHLFKLQTNTKSTDNEYDAEILQQEFEKEKLLLNLENYYQTKH